MKYCTHCGKELFDEAVICVGCGCPTNSYQAQQAPVSRYTLQSTLSQRVKINGIIWLAVGALQILGGIFWNWWLLFVGVLNIISAIQNLRYSQEIMESPTGIIARFEPVAGPIIALVYNVLFGGVIGVAGSIYYFVAIRKYVMENKQAFANLGAPTAQAAAAPVSTYSAKAAVKPSIPTAGTWVCNHCGTQNSTNYGQCKRCGKFRSK